MSNVEKTLGVQGIILGIILPSYVGIIIIPLFQDPYKKTTQYFNRFRLRPGQRSCTHTSSLDRSQYYSWSAMCDLATNGDPYPWRIRGTRRLYIYLYMNVVDLYGKCR